MPIVLQGSQSVPRSHHFDVSRVLMGMMKFAKEHGAVIALNSRVERLVWADDFFKDRRCTREGQVRREVCSRSQREFSLCAGGFRVILRCLEVQSTAKASCRNLWGRQIQGGRYPDGTFGGSRYVGYRLYQSYLRVQAQSSLN